MALRSPKLNPHGVIYPGDSRLSRWVSGEKPRPPAPVYDPDKQPKIEGGGNPLDEGPGEYQGDPLPPRRYKGPPF